MNLLRQKHVVLSETNRLNTMNKSFVHAVIKHEILKKRISDIVSRNYEISFFVCEGTGTKSDFNLRDLNRELINAKQ